MRSGELMASDELREDTSNELREDGGLELRDINIMATLDALVAQVAANKTVIDSAIVLINGIAARIAAAGADPAALAALVDDLKASDSALAAAVAANTPAA